MKIIQITPSPTKVRITDMDDQQLNEILFGGDYLVDLIECIPTVLQTFVVSNTDDVGVVAIKGEDEIPLWGTVYILGDDGLLGTKSLELMDMVTVLQKLTPINVDGKKFIKYGMEASDD